MTATDTTAAPRRLTRSRDERIVAGVCGGIARYYDIDPVIPRVVIAVLAVFGGAGLVVYAFGWLLVPEDGSPQTRLERWLDGHGGHSRDLIIVLAVLAVLAVLLPARPFGLRFSGVVFVLVVALVAAALAGRTRRTPQPWQPAQPVYGPPPPPAGWAAPAAAWEPPAPLQRRGSWLPWATFGAALLTAGTLSALAASGAAHPQPADVLAATLGVIGVGLLAGTFFGRAWSMIPVGVVLVVLLGAASVLPRDLTWSAGDRTWMPAASVTSATYVLGAGDALLDLRRVDPAQDVTVTGRIGAGRLRVLVPRDEAVDVRTRAGAGDIWLFGQDHSGIGQDIRRDISPVGAAGGTLTLDLHVGYGQLEVRRAAS